MTKERGKSSRIQTILDKIRSVRKEQPTVTYDEGDLQQRSTLENVEHRISQLRQANLKIDAGGLPFYNIRLTDEVRNRMSLGVLQDLGVERDQKPEDEIRVNVAFGLDTNGNEIYLVKNGSNERIKCFPEETSCSYMYIRQSFRQGDNNSGSGEWVDIGQASDAGDSVSAVLDAGVCRFTRSIRF